MNSTATAAVAAAAPKTVSLYAAKSKIYARAVSGRFAQWRWVFVWLTQLVFYGLPWLSLHGRQAVLFDITARRFYVFGLVLYPQDFVYLTALLLTSAYALFLFTAVAGRLWCGYACPQTVYTEIFMAIERRIEGDRAARMKLDAGPWNANKLLRKGGKQAAWVAVALWTGFTFVGYFNPMRQMFGTAADFGFSAWETFWILFYAFATYGNAGFMREQICKFLCPYARFQSAMFDKDTLIISYDAGRGEPRGVQSRKAGAGPTGLGDCVDCNLCVQVCPTGIDIRKGLQYECIGCAACIDACDTVMQRYGKAAGLVRYDTQNGLALHLDSKQRLARLMRPRVLVYTSVLMLILAGVGTSLALRPPFKVDVVRDRASLARQVDDGFTENLYRLQVMNATESEQRYTVRAAGLAGLALATPIDIRVGPAQAQWVTAALRVPPQTAASTAPGAHPIQFLVERQAAGGEGARTIEEKSTFVLPR